MKKIIIILFSVCVIAVLALAVFVFTFDLNRYRPQIEKQASAAVGHAVKIGNLSLAWHGGLAIEVDGVQIFSNDEPVLKIQSAGAVLQVAPLLRRSIQIGSIFLDGADIRVVKNKEGQVEVQGLSFAAKPVPSEVEDKVVGTTTSADTSKAWTSFLINSLNLKDIHVHYEDDTAAFPVQLDLRNVELSVKNVSLFRPMEFEAAAALFGSKQNLHLSGRLKVDDQGSKVSVENFKVESDLGLIDLIELSRSLPKLMEKSPVTAVAGKLKADIQQLSFRNGKLDDFQADVALTNGQVSAFGASPLLDHVQVTVNRFRPNVPVEFKVQSGILSDESNLSFQGRLEMGDAGRLMVGPAQIDLDLDRLNWNRVESFMPAVKGAGLSSPPEGRLHADIKRIDLQPNREPSADVDFRYDQGRLRLKALPQELSSINLTGTLRGNQLTLDAWNMNFGTSPAEGRLNVQNLFSAPIFRTELKARNLELKNLIPPAPAGQPQLEGMLSFELNLGGNGKVPEVILPSLAGSGHFLIQTPIVRNLNALEQVFTKLSAIPGVSDALNQRMSDSLKERLSKKDTILQTIDQDFSIQNQNIYFESFEVVSSDLMVRGPVNVSIEGQLQARPTIWIHEEIMAELASRVNELAFALNSKGQLQIPLSVSGKAPQISVTPDIQFLLGEMVRNRSSVVLGNVAQRVASGQGLGKLSQILGTTPYSTDENAQTAADTSATTEQPYQAEDNSVPVKVYSPQTQQQPQSLLGALTGGSSQSGSGQPQNQKTQIAIGLLNSFLSSGSNSNSESGTDPNLSSNSRN